MINAGFATLLSELAVLMELKGENPFKIRAYKKASQIIEGLATDIGGMSRKELLEVSGIGHGIADKIDEFVKNNCIREHQDLAKCFPAGILTLLAVPNLGPKRAKFLYENLRIDSADALKAAAQRGRLKDLPGFGPKLEQNILKGLALVAGGPKRMLLWEARLLMRGLISQLSDVSGVKKIEPAGSLRRGKETVGDLDILCAASNADRVSDRLVKLPAVKSVLAQGPTKSSVILKSGAQCDLRVVGESSFGAALQYFTGSKEHNVALRERALKLGWTINEYGLFRLSDKEHKKPLASKTEQEIYKKLGLDYIPPELRENRGEIEAAEAGKLPELVEESDIKGCFHNHTTESDGADSLEDMVAAAKKKGWEWYAVADHSPSLKIAGGLEVERLKRKMDAIAALNKKSGGIRVLCSSEVDILKDGNMDYPDEVLAALDIVVGSIHSGFKQAEDQLTSRIAAAMENPHVDCIGHLTGRLLGKRDAYALNLEKIIDTAARTGTAIEINGQPDRQDMYDVHARQARDKGVMLAANTDAHSTHQLDFMSVAVTVARRAWLQKEDVLNTKSWKDLSSWLQS